MREVLQRHLEETGSPDLRVRECRIANTRRRDGSRGTVEYELTLEHRVSGATWDQRVTGATFGGDRTRRAWASLRQADAPADGNGPAPGFPPFAYLPELDLLLQAFPHDYRLPALAELMAGPPADITPTLLAVFGDGAWELAEWRAEPIQYRVDMRAILRLTVRARNRDGASAERQLYAKIYRDADDCRRAFTVQRAVSERAAEAAASLVAARAIALLDGRRTMVTEALPGTSLSKIVRRGDAVAPPVRAAARAIAQFHQLDIAVPPRSIADETARLREAEAFLAGERPDLAAQVSTIVEAVAAGLADAPMGLIHGDLKPDHVLIDGDRVALIDFDLAAAADPVADVAHLVAFLGKPQERARHRSHEPVDAAAIFVEEYFAHAPPSWRQRLPLYHAMTAIHKAVGLRRRRGVEGEGRLEDVLREAQALLGGDAHTSVPTFKRRMMRTAARAR